MKDAGPGVDLVEVAGADQRVMSTRADRVEREVHVRLVPDLRIALFPRVSRPDLHQRVRALIPARTDVIEQRVPPAAIRPAGPLRERTEFAAPAETPAQIRSRLVAAS